MCAWGLTLHVVMLCTVLQIYIQLHTVRTQSVACTDSICQRRQLRRISYPSRLVPPRHRISSLDLIDPRLGVPRRHTPMRLVISPSVGSHYILRSKRPGYDKTAASPANSPHLTPSRPRDGCQHLSIVTPRKFSCAGK